MCQYLTAAEGGVFGCGVMARSKPRADFAHIVRQLESSLGKTHGVLFSPWIEYLLEADRCDLIWQIF